MKNSFLKSAILAEALLSLFARPSFADPVSVNPRPRMEAMGNAGVAALGNQDSAMMNPAGLADVEASSIDNLGLLIEIPYEIGFIQDTKDFKDKVDKEGATKAEKQAALEEYINNAPNAAAMRVNFYPSYTRKYLHFGVLVDGYAEPRVYLGGLGSNQATDFGGSSITTGLILGGGYGFLKNSLQVGLTLKPLYRMSVGEEEEQTVLDILRGRNAPDSNDPDPSVEDELFGKSKLDKRAFAFGADLGIKYIVPMESLGFLKNLAFLKPSAGLTVQDIGDTRFFTDKALPQNIPMSVSTGLAIHPSFKGMRNTVALDFRNINEDQSILNMLHFGVETVLFNFWAIRAGLSQLYWTVGTGVNLSFLDFDVYINAYEQGKAAHVDSIRTIGLRLTAGF